ncbi:MAG TPA: nucleoside hydrolase [Patescibacteria group bacterium]|nr:nucleoside hydrolase [Patescibacteria group bacterium]
MKKKIIIDTDPGHDDAMAIMLAVKSGAFDILAITTVCGNSTIENTTRNARFVLQVLDREDIPVYSGANKPLKQDLIQAVVHGKTGLEGIDPTNEAKLTNNAVDKIIELIKKYPGEITLVTLAPLTNIAMAIQKDPKTMDKLKQIVTMGGAINVAGNKNRVAEFNVFVDPDAAKIVFDFPVKKTLVPLDACNHVQLTLKDFQSITNKNLQNILVKLVKPYIQNIAKDVGVHAALMYDPLTVYYLLDANACKRYDDNVLVETEGEITRGMTVIDKRSVKDDLKPNMTIVTHISQAKFRRTFINFLSR